MKRIGMIVAVEIKAVLDKYGSALEEKNEAAKDLFAEMQKVLEGKVKDGKVFVGEDCVLEINGVADQDVYIGIRPEGFELDDNGALHCQLSNVEVMGRDVSIVSTHAASENPQVRSIIDADNKIDVSKEEVCFSLKAHKTFIFNKDTEERIFFEEK